MRGTARVLGICGGSGAGKTYLVNQIVARCERDGATTAVVSFDAYYRDLAHLTRDERSAVNFDHPASLDVELFVEHLALLAAGDVVDIPVYDFANHTRRTDVTAEAGPADLVVTDGILLLAFAAIRERLDTSVFLDCPPDVRLDRRIARDTVERGRAVYDVERQWTDTVAPMHDEFVGPYAETADVVVPFEHDRHSLLDELLAQLVR